MGKSETQRVRFYATLFLVLAFGFMVGITVMASWYSVTGFNTVSLEQEDDIVEAFHVLYHNNWWNRTVMDTYWLGAQTMKCPLDTWVFQEIIFETRPDVIVETGTRKGGSALYFASIFDLIGNGRVMTVDIVDYPDKPQHERITYLVGSSTASAIIEEITRLIEPGESVMVFLDSDHSKDHVLEELRLYSDLVSEGNYLIVEDTHLNGHPVFSAAVMPGPGPMEAVQEFLSQDSSFVVDHTREKYGLTFNPSGFLKRTASLEREVNQEDQGTALELPQQ